MKYLDKLLEKPNALSGKRVLRGYSVDEDVALAITTLQKQYPLENIVNSILRDELERKGLLQKRN